MQFELLDEANRPAPTPRLKVAPFKTQLLKWIGNKQRFAHEIVSYFPATFGRYFEPFIGSAGVLATMSPGNAIGSDTFSPLIEIWQTLHDDPDRLTAWYAERWHQMMRGDKVEEYERIKAAYNKAPNGADLLFLCRSCYGGVVRFRRDGYMSTPCGAHAPVTPDSFAQRVDLWRPRIAGTTFVEMDYTQAMAAAQEGDLIYCDPPYTHTQAILYGAQSFSLARLLDTIAACKRRGVYVALSIDGSKRSGDLICDVPVPEGLFEQEVYVNVGRSMLRRFQMGGETLEGEVVADRLLLTYPVRVDSSAKVEPAPWSPKPSTSASPVSPETGCNHNGRGQIAEAALVSSPRYNGDSFVNELRQAQSELEAAEREFRKAQQARAAIINAAIRAGMTHRKVAEILGIKQPVVSKIVSRTERQQLGLKDPRNGTNPQYHDETLI
jgi:DNA adenine methylase